jgi:hypothetical protein
VPKTFKKKKFKQHPKKKGKIPLKAKTQAPPNQKK